MKKVALLFFPFFSFLQNSCMIVSHKHRPIPCEIIETFIGNLDYKSNIQFIMTCKNLYRNYAEENDLLITRHCLNSNDYTGAMVYFARKNDAKKIELLMHHEGIDNKNNRENILTYFGVDHTTDPQKVIEIYKKKYDKESSYQDAESFPLINCISVLQLLLKQGFDPNVKGNLGHTALFEAAFHYNIDKLKLLLADSRVDPNVKDSKGYTALFWAICHGNIDNLKLLLADPRVNPNIKDNLGCTALSSAVSHNETIDNLKLLLADSRVDPNIKDNSGWTPLFRAVFHHSIDKLELLLADFRVDPNVKNNSGYTALLDAASRGNIDSVKLLLANSRVDPNITVYWLTAYHLSREPEIVQLLSERTSLFNKHKAKFCCIVAAGLVALGVSSGVEFLYGLYKA